MNPTYPIAFRCWMPNSAPPSGAIEEGAGPRKGNINLRDASLRKMGLPALRSDILTLPKTTVAPIELQSVTQTVQGEIGRGLQQEFCVKALCKEAETQNLKPIREAPVTVLYREHGLGNLFWDMLIRLGGQTVGIEVKAIGSLSLRHLLKARSQLKFSACDRAYLINFSARRGVEIHRIDLPTGPKDPPSRQLSFPGMTIPRVRPPWRESAVQRGDGVVSNQRLRHVSPNAAVSQRGMPNSST